MSTYTFNGVTYDSTDLTGADGRGYNDTVTTGTGVTVPRYVAPMIDAIEEASDIRDAADAFSDAASASASAASASAAAAAAVVANSMTTTSTSSVAIGTGSKSFTLASLTLPITVGIWFKVFQTSTPANYVWGNVTAWNSGTGVLTLNVTRTGGSGTISAWTATATGADGADGAPGATISEASASEVNTGSETTKYISPDSFNGSNHGLVPVEFAYISGASPEVGNGAAYVTIPARMNGMDIVAVEAEFTGDVATGSVTTIMLHNATSAADILSTALTVDASERSSATAVTAAVINTSEDDLTTGDLIRLDIDGIGSTTAGTGLVVRALCRKP